MLRTAAATLGIVMLGAGLIGYFAGRRGSGSGRSCWRAVPAHLPRAWSDLAGVACFVLVLVAQRAAGPAAAAEAADRRGYTTRSVSAPGRRRVALRPRIARKDGVMGFMDMRQWMGLLEKEGELRRINAEVDWDRELGAVARRVLEKKGPALLFENIKGYRTGRCTKLFTGGLGDRRRLALALGFPKDVANAELRASTS